MIKLILFLAFLFNCFLTFSQEKYNLKNVIVYADKGNCDTEKENPTNLIFCNWTCALSECVDKPCWLTVHRSNGRIYQGVAIHAIAGHQVWFKELNIYDQDFNLINSIYDSAYQVSTFIRMGKRRAIEYLNKYKKYYYLNGDSISTDSMLYRKPNDAKEKLKDVTYLKKLGCK